MTFASHSRESQEVAQKVAELQKRLNEAREQVKLIPGEQNFSTYEIIFAETFSLLGIDQSKEQQLEHLDNLKKQLVLKQELINKYKQYNF